MLETLKVMYTNADTFTNKWDEFKARVLMKQPDIIGVAEVKPKRTNQTLNYNEFNLKEYNYDLYPLNIDNKIGRGMLLYVKNNLQRDEITLPDDFSEAIAMKIQTEKNRSLIIVLTYRSDSGTPENNEKLLKVINNLSQRKECDVLFFGDFNFPKINWEEISTCTSDISIEKKFIDCLNENYLQQYTDEPTRFQITEK